ncbi:MAG TPA: HAD family hydrolase [Patescibacteria group bacterium]|nr:HAD family hydrolase [Patescibacteria group bacterium]
MTGLATLNAALAAAAPRLLSVDVFDTLLLRRTRPEYRRFIDVAQLQDIALAPASPGADRLLSTRLSVTRRAYAAVRDGTGRGEVQFTAILAEMCRELGLDTAAIALLEQVELDYETSVLTPNRRLAEALNATGIPIAAVSDTPLSAAAVATLLRRLLPELVIARLYASSDVGLTKRAGTLFDYLCEREAVRPEHVLHLGDHPWSDRDMPRQRGLQALHLPRPVLWRWLHGLRHRLIRHTLRRRGLIPPAL